MSTKNFKIGDQVKLIRTEAIHIPNEFLGCTGKIIDIQQGNYFVEFDNDPHTSLWCCGDKDLAAPPERILCVAIKFGDLICSQPAPARHFHIFRALGGIGVGPPIPTHGQVQGFLTDTGRFVDRQEARQIAEAAGQILQAVDEDGVPRTCHHRDLFSEDVW